MYTDGELRFDNAVMLNENPVNITRCCVNYDQFFVASFFSSQLHISSVLLEPIAWIKSALPI